MYWLGHMHLILTFACGLTWGGTRARGFFYEIKLQKNLRFLKKVPKMFIFCKSIWELILFFVNILFFKFWTFSSFRYGPSRHQNGICLENIIKNTFCQKCSMCSDVRQQNNSPTLSMEQICVRNRFRMFCEFANAFGIISTPFLTFSDKGDPPYLLQPWVAESMSEMDVEMEDDVK